MGSNKRERNIFYRNATVFVTYAPTDLGPGHYQNRPPRRGGIFVICMVAFGLKSREKRHEIPVKNAKAEPK